MKKYLVEYTSNNSGGYWWLEDKDWKNLKKKGWRLFGHGNFSYDKSGNRKEDSGGFPVFKGKLQGSLGAYANYAFKRFDSIKEALEEFEKVTGQNVSDEGWNCCGAPHCFSWDSKGKDRGYCSGEDCLEYLYLNKNASLTKRELLEKL